MDPRENDERRDRARALDCLRAASLRPSSFDEESHTIDVVFSTGARVEKMDWRQETPYIEDLPLAGMNMAELNAGAHVLRQHGMDRGEPALDNVFGSVVPGTARVEEQDGQQVAVARVKLSRAPEDASLVQKIRDGIIRKWSYGYRRVGPYRAERDPQTGLEVRTWETHVPYEISAVDVPADAYTDTRSRQEHRTEEEKTMEPKPKPEERADERQAPQVDEQAIRAQAEADGARRESERQTAIRDLIRKGDLDESAAEVRAILTDPQVTIEAAALRLWDLRVKRDTPPPEQDIRPGHTSLIRDETDTRRQAMTEGLMFRAAGTGEPSDIGRRYAGASYLDVARGCLRAAGLRDVEFMSKDQVFRLALNLDRDVRMVSTSDLPLILGDAANKNFRAGMANVVENYLPLVAVRQVADFKTQNEYQLSSGPTLDETPEGAEIKYGTLSEGREQWSILSYTKGWRITRKALINDDMNAIGSAPQRFGQGVTRTKLNLFWALFTGPAVLDDGADIFTGRSNVTASSGAAPDVTEIGKGRKLMRLQKEIGSLDELNLMPDALIAPAALETGIDQLMTNITPATSSNAVPQKYTAMSVIVEPRLDANSVYFWYMATFASQYENFVMGQLAGSPGPRFRSRESWDVQGMEMLVEYDVGFAAIDFRGLYRNKGQA